MCLEELVEHGRIREMQFENDLLDAVIGVLEHILSLQNHERVDPVGADRPLTCLISLERYLGVRPRWLA